MYIYKITNKINGKTYIGKTTQSIKVRFNEHMWDVRNRCNSYFHNALKKYGKDNFSLECLFECTSEQELTQKEIEVIKSYKDQGVHLYNMTPGGEGVPKGTPSPMLGKKHTLEFKKRLSQLRMGKKRNYPPWNKGIPKTEEEKRKISNSLKGKKKPEGFSEKLRIANLKENLSQETLEKRRKSLTGKEYPKSKGDNISRSKNGKMFEVYDIRTNEKVGQWFNKSQCARDLGFKTPTGIWDSLRYNKPYGIYLFKYNPGE